VEPVPVFRAPASMGQEGDTGILALREKRLKAGYNRQGRTRDQGSKSLTKTPRMGAAHTGSHSQSSRAPDDNGRSGNSQGCIRAATGHTMQRLRGQDMHTRWTRAVQMAGSAWRERKLRSKCPK
jgi:hypothetical protein